MKFEVGNIAVQVFYLHDELTVSEAIAYAQPLIAKLRFERDVRMATLQQAVSDRLYPQQWALQKIAIEAAWARVAEVAPPRPPVTVAVIDSGIQLNHQD